MSAPNFGIQTIKIDNEPRPVIAPDLSTIGLIGPAPDADPTLFPLDTPVKIYSHDTTLIKKLGEAGYLADALRGVNDQLGEMQFAAVCVLVRTAEGTNANSALKMQETIAKIMGSSTLGTGLFAFLQSADLLAVTPRLLLAPGYTGQMANGVASVAITEAGDGYDPEDPPAVTFSGGGSNATIVQATGHAVVNEDGEVTAVIIDTPGQWYTAAPTVAIAAPGTGTQATATATIELLANPVVASMTSVLNQLLGHAIVESSGTSEQGDEDWRETINSQRIIPVSGGCKVIDPETGAVVVRPVAPRIAGIAIRRDHEKGAPFHSWANQPVQGIVGPGRAMKFVLTDGANEGQQLIGNNLGVVVRGQLGNELAISSGGFVYIGTDNAGDDELWRFYNVTRGRDYIHLGLIRTLRYYLGKFNITRNAVQQIVNTMESFLLDLQANEHILGFKCYFLADKNSPEQIRLGHLTISFAAEEPPPLKVITIESSRYRPAIEAMVADLAAQLNLAA